MLWLSAELHHSGPLHTYCHRASFRDADAIRLYGFQTTGAHYGAGNLSLSDHHSISVAIWKCPDWGYELASDRSGNSSESGRCNREPGDFAKRLSLIPKYILSAGDECLQVHDRLQSVDGSVRRMTIYWLPIS